MRVRRIGHKYFSAEKSCDPVSRQRSDLQFSTQAKRLACFTTMRVRRIELLSHPWQGRVLPLNHTRLHCHNNLAEKTKRKCGN